MNITDITGFDNECTGCSACVQICPVQAIEFEKNDEGFGYPVIKGEKCVDCQKCLKVCGIANKSTDKMPISVFSAYSKREDIRRQGSSGGVVVALSERTINNGGVVYGAVFHKGNNEIRHGSSDNFKLSELSRSKYAQSHIGNSFISVKSDLESGREVLFCGTPCQVEGLINYLGRDYGNLITVDFFCHGVPSPGLFKEMVDGFEKQENSRVENISFRDKKDGWHSLALSVSFENGKEVRIPSNDSPYYYFFLNNYSLRKSCYSCERYKKHAADITVADYWLVDKEKDDNNGISLVLAGTEKGKKIIDGIGNELVIEEITKQPDYSVYKHNYSRKNSDVFFSSYTDKGMEFVFEDLFNKEKSKNRSRGKFKKKLIGFLRK
ncbi:MAG: Coenzyme F420 hydrogenase/dehydrogenase, beta subunit C-terminal domain [Acutalibacteraceae bacterium]